MSIKSKKYFYLVLIAVTTVVANVVYWLWSQSDNGVLRVELLK